MTQHQEGTAYHGIDLEIENDFRPGMAALFRELPYAGVGAGAAEGGNHPQECIAIEGIKVPHPQHHRGAGGNDCQPGQHSGGGFVF